MADYVRHGEVGVIYINNPPVNALNRATWTAIYHCAKQSASDDTIATVICGRGKQFSAGADIAQFGGSAGVMNNHPSLNDAINELENSTKPVVAAIERYALGGGFEVALGCHYRIATPEVVVGFPEVKLGILPAAGGTQRFPRLVGLDIAMQWISSGKQYPVGVAEKVGVFDLVVAKGEEFLPKAIQFAKSVAGKPLTPRRVSSMAVKDAHNVGEIAAKHMKRLHEKSRGQHSPLACIQAVEFAAASTFPEGIKKEVQIFSTLVTSGQSRGLIHSFFGERHVKKWSVPGTSISWKSSKVMPIASAAVVGIGTMGRGIVINFLKAGIPVLVKEQNADYLKAGMQKIHTEIDEMEKHQAITREQNLMMKSAITGTQDYQDLRDVDIVIEAVFEEIEVKQQVFENLEKVCKSSAILATNTSALDIDEIASFTRRPDKVMGMHFFAPAHLMRLLENVYGRRTSPETISTCMDLGRKMGQVTVLVGNCRGFVANRMYIHYMSECEFLLEEGSYPRDVDKALTEYGFAMGRFLVADLSGNDVLYRVRRAAGLTGQGSDASETERKGLRYCALADLLCGKGRFGMKAGKGWYDYRKPNIPEPSVEIKRMIDDYRARNHITPRRIDSQEIIERALYALINEGFKVLDEGFASGPTDVDMIWIHGYAWPKHTGGPMFHAHAIGLPTLLRRIRYYYSKFGDKAPHWRPSEMLTRIVERRGNLPMDEWMKYSTAASSMQRSNL